MSTIGGKNYKKFKKESKVAEEKKYLVSKKDYPDSIYAKVTRMLGSGRLMAKGQDNKEYNCVIRGRLYKKEWIKAGDLLVILPRDYEKGNNADVIHKLSEDEINEYSVKDYFIEQDSGDDNIKFDTQGIEREFNFDEL